MNKEVVGIYTCPDKGLPMQSHQRVNLLIGMGIEGDRYALGRGAWTGVRDVIRHVSIISLLVVERSGFTPEETRRNFIITISPEALNDLVDHYFTIGEANFRGVEPCEPCKRPSVLSKKPGFEEKFKGFGGLRAAVLSSGQVEIGSLLI